MSNQEDRLSHEREVMQADYEARRAGMLRLAIIMGVIVILALLAMFVGLLSLSGDLGDFKTNASNNHNCTDAKLNEILTGGHDVTPLGCPQ